MHAKIKYSFSGEVWKHTGVGGWFFISVPVEISAEIREQLQWQEEGWGRLKATARVHALEWETAIWFDKKHNTYLLPLKSEIRKKGSITEKDVIGVTLYV